MNDTSPSLRLAVVILNYRTAQLVTQCLESLEGELTDQDQVLVVDNCSADGSAEAIQKEIEAHGWGDWVTLLQSPHNRGFSAGNNYALSRYEAEAYLLLNSDTIVRPNSVETLYKALVEHPSAGIVSPRLEWPDGEPQISCFRDFTPVSEIIHSAATGPVTKALEPFNVSIPVNPEPNYPQWTSFAAVMIRGEAVRQVGLMDEGYFMYYEDADYCRRVRLAGWEILNWPEAHIVHLRGGSSDVKKDTEARRRRKRYYYAARARYLAKFGSPGGLILCNMCWGIGRCVSLIREGLGHRKSHLCEREAQDIWTNWFRPLSGKHGMEQS